MEYNEEELDNVVGGTTHEVGENSALENEDLFRGKSIEDLKQLREEILNGELTEEALDDVKAGIKM